jgi:hypothetical protein
MQRLFLLLFLLSSVRLSAQSLPILTNQQMLSDFDTLCKSILEISPQHVVRKKVTGLDMQKELLQIRNQLSAVHSQEEFLFFVQRALTLCQDGHTSLIGPNYLPARKNYEELGISDTAIDLLPKYDSIIKNSSIAAKKFILPLKYLRGEYYTVAAFTFQGTTFPAGLKLLQCNGRKIHEFVMSLYSYKRMMRWDFEKKRYFAEDFYQANNLTAKEQLTLVFEGKDRKRINASFPLGAALSFNDSISIPQDKNKKVEYWENEQLLYIRVPRMAEPDYYPPLIRSLTAAKPLKKVIIDIRDNPGGGDGVWMNILTTLIRNPIVYKDFILCNNTKALKARFPEESPGWKLHKEKTLDNYGYAVFYSGENSIDPDSASIKFNKTIYVLQNENIYSSAGSLAAVAVLSPQLKTVGNNTGRLLGKGVSPLLFELPHSKIMYRIEPVIDFLNVKTPKDIYHDTVELPVDLSIEEYLDRLKYKGDLYSKEYLLQYDPVFRKAYKVQE